MPACRVQVMIVFLIMPPTSSVLQPSFHFGTVSFWAIDLLDARTHTMDQKRTRALARVLLDPYGKYTRSALER